ALNRSLAGEDQLILTSRSTEFAAAVHTVGDVLSSAVVLEPQPLDPTAAADYLRRCLPPRPGPAWEQILTTLRSSAELCGPVAALAETASTALGLWLLRAVYVTPRADPTPLLDPGQFPDTAALRTHLFDKLIPTLIDTRTPSDDPVDLFRPHHHHNPEQVRRWLGYLAHLGTKASAGDSATGTRDFAWWRLAHDTHALRRSTRVGVGLAAGLLGGLVMGLVIPDSTVRFWVGLGAGLVIWVLVARGAEQWPQESPGFADLRVRGRLGLLPRHVARNMTRLGFAGALITMMIGEPIRWFSALGYPYWHWPGLGLMVVYVLLDGLWFGLIGGLVCGLVGGLVFGLIQWVETPAHTERRNTPMSSWHADRTLNTIRITVAGLGSGFAFMGFSIVMTWSEHVVSYVVMFLEPLLWGVVGGLAFALAVGKHRAWLAYLVATYRLARAGRLPRRLMPFLDDAHRLGLLRTVGPIYQFRHAELQDHLAATYHQPG
ncbi:MAG: hypothetical protein ACRDQ5_19510, partial [Sciscionella sp.]